MVKTASTAMFCYFLVLSPTKSLLFPAIKQVYTKEGGE